MISSSRRTTTSALAFSSLLFVVGFSNAFQLPSTSTTSTSPYQHCYFTSSGNQQKICTPLKPSSSSTTTNTNNNNNKREVSLYISLLPQDDDTLLPQQEDAEFFAQTAFPDSIPSELTDFAVPTSSGMNDNNSNDNNNNNKAVVLWNSILESYWGPRIVLMVIAAVYGTNFPLGAIMNDALPASAATCARMTLASLALSPFLFQIKPHLRGPAILCGCGTAMGYVAQSLALVDTDPSKVSFLGAAIVLWVPVLEWLVEKKPMGLKDAPQTWLAALLCIMGVGALELYQPGVGINMDMMSSVTSGDFFSIVQAIGFGTGCFLSARMVQKEPDQVLPITSVLIATTAFWSMLWCFSDGWMGQPGSDVMMLPNLLFADGYQTVAMAVVWTGLISTSLNFVIEISALGRVPASEASVLLASEPLWAALFAATVFQQSEFGASDYIGGACILMACLANAVLKPSHFHGLWGSNDEGHNSADQPPQQQDQLLLQPDSKQE